MAKVIGIRFRNNGKVYYFDPKDLPLRNGGQVIVETARGIECGSVVLSPREVADERVQQPLRPVIRVATEDDLERERSNREKEKEAYRICRQKIRERGLDMKLIKAEYSFDNKKVLFYFTADGRVDFRELVKDLASVFKTRIELRQIGVRDETKLLGGIGICGRPLCCSTFLSDFSSVSIKMAKEQNLSLNPTKISGTCGRLMCCLKNEQETYEFLNKNLPGVGDIVAIAEREETGEVQSVNVLRQTARVIIDEGGDKEIEEFPAEELEVVMTRRKKNKERAKERERERERAKAEKELAAQNGEKTAGDRQSGDRQSGERQPGEKAAGDRAEGRFRDRGRSRNASRSGVGRAENARPVRADSSRAERPEGRMEDAGERPERSGRGERTGRGARNNRIGNQTGREFSDQEAAGQANDGQQETGEGRSPRRRRRNRRRREPGEGEMREPREQGEKQDRGPREQGEKQDRGPREQSEKQD